MKNGRTDILYFIKLWPYRLNWGLTIRGETICSSKHVVSYHIYKCLMSCPYILIKHDLTNHVFRQLCETNLEMKNELQLIIQCKEPVNCNNDKMSEFYTKICWNFVGKKCRNYVRKILRKPF